MKFLILIYKEIIQFLRNRGLLLFLIYSFTLDIYLAATGIELTLKNAKFYVQDFDFSPLSRELISSFPEPYFKFKGYILNNKDIETLLTEDKAVGVIRIPSHFEERIKEGKSEKVGVVVNGAEISTSYLFSAYAQEVIYNFLAKLAPMYPSMESKIIEAKTRIFFNQNASSKTFMAYSELITVITLFLLLLPASAVVMEKERGNIEMLMVSPVKTHTVLIVKAISMGILILLSSLFAISITIQHFCYVPFHGKTTDFAVLTAFYIFATVGLSLFIASLSRNMLQVSQLSVLILIPILYLSGNWSPIETMPKILQWLSNLSPLKFYIDGVYGIAVKGLTLQFLTKDLFFLSLQGLILFGLSNYLLKKIY